MMEPMFQFDNVVYRYGGSDAQPAALNGISFEIPRGSRTALIGPNGAGKSTLIFHMNGLFRCASGTVRIMGEPVTKSNQAEWVRKVGVVFQDPDDQIVSMTVKDDIAFGPLQLGRPVHEAHRIAEECMALLAIEPLAARNPSELSFGQKKMVAIAGVLAMDTEAVIVDEPMAFLDPEGQRLIHDVLTLLAQRGKTVVIATHQMQLVAEWAEQAIVIREGACLGSMTPRELFGCRPELLASARLDLPPVAKLMSAFAWNPPESMPIRMEEARQWLRQQQDL
ncbi:energy-coupling factor ABC transporter ATP-binding protein [Paenibacillus sp. tmac-D7]|uniref:energy-coupling factor ABC transporter ATP-binding protein n=1 Tax=Paenibacillus sp. tmac-D7 TaxID=2591462 RepID=UPI00215AFDA0|nr:ATP-binding cassette domain-containing protein [Paenibacillus sp. tmac-D7]